MKLEKFITGEGQVLQVHRKNDSCKNCCVVHNPSNHSMISFPTYWREDRQLMERICPHGVGHPDPDDLRFKESLGLLYEGIHGCDGCCIGPNATELLETTRDSNLEHIREIDVD